MRLNSALRNWRLSISNAYIKDLKIYRSLHEKWIKIIFIDWMLNKQFAIDTFSAKNLRTTVQLKEIFLCIRDNHKLKWPDALMRAVQHASDWGLIKTRSNILWEKIKFKKIRQGVENFWKFLKKFSSSKKMKFSIFVILTHLKIFKSSIHWKVHNLPIFLSFK